MLHELLAALSGHPGGIFVEDPQSGVVKVVEDLPFIHPSETSLLNRLCRLVTHCVKFDRFLQQYGPVPLTGSNNHAPVPGSYVRSFAQGLDHVLQQYRHSLLDIESKLLSDPDLTAAYLQAELEEYQLLFPVLLTLVENVTDKKVYGCNVLEMLYKASSSAIPSIQATLDKILHICHVVLYKQLSSYILHGQLFDPFDEFFICRSQVADVGESPANADVSLDDELDVGGVTGRQLSRIMQLSEPQMPSTASGCFSIRAGLLPSYIPLHVAEKILFVGESVNMFGTEKDNRPNRNKNFGSLLDGREDEFAQDIVTLSKNATFDLMLLEDFVDKIRSCVAAQLWTFVVENADLPAHLRTLKDFYLLGRGELYLVFIDQAHAMLRVPMTSTTRHDVNLAFQHAARDVLFENESVLQHFALEFEQKRPKDSGSGQRSVESGWDCLKLTYTADWPLHILFSMVALYRYNVLFTFLLRIRRVQLQLQQCWAQQMHRRHLRCAVDTHSSTNWWLRNHMAFLIDNLQYYLQVDVIESQFSNLLNKIESTRDFEAIRLAHDQFLSSLFSQCFLHMKPVSHCLNEILELCNAFCGLVSHSDVVLSAQEILQLDEIATGFQRQSSLLFKVLSSVRSHQTSPHLAQLLLRIDYNKFFTLSCGGAQPSQTVSVRRTVPAST